MPLGPENFPPLRGSLPEGARQGLAGCCSSTPDEIYKSSWGKLCIAFTYRCTKTIANLIKILSPTASSSPSPSPSSSSTHHKLRQAPFLYSRHPLLPRRHHLQRQMATTWQPRCSYQVAYISLSCSLWGDSAPLCPLYFVLWSSLIS